MKEYRDPVSKMFCVTFDNSYLMDSFFKEVQTLSIDNLTYIMRNYVDNKVKSRYDTTNNNIIQGLYYNPFDEIKATSKNDLFYKNDKMFIYDSGAFGECVKKPVLFLENRDKKTCGKKFVTKY